MRSLRLSTRLPFLLWGVCVATLCVPRPLSLHAQHPSPRPVIGALGVLVRGSSSLTPGTEAALRIATHEARSEQHSQPLAGVHVQISLSGSGHSAPLTEGISDSAGILDARYVVPDWPAGRYVMRIRSQIAGQERTQEQSVTLEPSVRILVQSDKPLYQPGQVLRLRTLTMRAQDGHPLSSGTILFVVKDPRGNIISRSERAVSAFGIASTEVPLADELLLGSYTVQASLVMGKRSPSASPASLVVEVSRYVLPKLRLDLTAEQDHLLPGQELRFSVAGQYVQGKPVQGGSVTISARLLSKESLSTRELPTLVGTLSDQGQQSFRLAIPASLEPGEHRLVLDGKVEDAATQQATVHKEIRVSTTPLHLDLVAESGELIPQVRNQIHVLAVRPDGTPIPDLAVNVQVGSAPVQKVRTNAIGLAKAEHTPAPIVSGQRERSDRCSAGELSVSAQVTLPGREPLKEERCIKVRSEGGLLLRTDKAIYARGESPALTVSAPSVESGLCFVDVMRGSQLQDTLVIPIHKGHGTASMTPRDRASGTLSLLAYVVREDGKQARHDRLIYVEPPSALAVTAKIEPVGSDSARPLRPGDATRLRFKVVDSQTGVGVPAALGVVMIDEALLALRPLRPGLLRAYFTLGDAAKKAAAMRALAPRTLTLDTLVERGALSDLEQQVAQFLLSGAVAPWSASWMTDPWEERRKELHAREKLWSDAVKRFATQHPERMGERVPGQKGQWRYRRSLPDLMRAEGTLTAESVLDPWRRTVQTETLVKAAQLPSFEEYALHLLDQKLTAVYRALSQYLATEEAKRSREKQADGSVLLLAEDLTKLGNLSLLDPWGTPLRLHVRSRVHSVGKIRSKAVIWSAGPDGVFGNADDLFPSSNLCHRSSCTDQLRGIEVIGVSASLAFAHGQIGCGCGYGAAYGGVLAGFSSRPVSVAVATAESIPGPVNKRSVRSRFPETLLYQPQLLTDQNGEASMDVTLADSITTWRLFADAVAQDGRLGSLMMGIPVHQDFFVDLDVPQVITQHDELAIPVPIYNHQQVGQRVTLTLMQEPWFEPQGPLHETIDLAPSQATVRYFRIKAALVGRRSLRLSARGSVLSDEVERRVEVLPDGTEHTASMQQRLMSQPVSWNVSVPAMVIPGTSELTLKLYPRSAAHVIEGLDSMLRMPYGCFEQTSSTTYPNALILQYLRKLRLNQPDIERKALDYLAVGYQRLLSYEVQGGGFSWFGNAPAHKILTAYGLEEFADMAEVFPVDPRVIERTQHWLVQQQNPDGSFTPDAGGIREGAINAVADDLLRTTAYLALSIRRTDPKGIHKAAVNRAKEFVHQSLRNKVSEDPYTLALVAELLGDVAISVTAPKDIEKAAKREQEVGLKDARSLSLIAQLWSRAKMDPTNQRVYFEPLQSTPTYGSGRSAIVETTAVVASALHQVSPSKVPALLAYLRGTKDSAGNWQSTQATIRALKALLAGSVSDTPVEGVVKVMMDGVLHQSIAIQAKQESLLLVTLTPPREGTHQVTLQFVGKGTPDVQLLSRYYLPRVMDGHATQPTQDSPLRLRTTLSNPVIGREQSVVATAYLSAKKDFMMPLLQLGIPPGCSVERESLDRLVDAGRIERYEISLRYVTLYLRKLTAQQEVQLPVKMTAHVPGRMQVPSSSLYPYYQPELVTNTAPEIITVNP